MTNETTARLLALYHEASDEQRANGAAWYSRMRRGCGRIARTTGTPLRRVVATAAITSPDAQLSTNLAWTRTACETRGAALVGRYPNAMAAKYRPILQGSSRPVDTVGGDKVTNFYRAILGDDDAVVLDRHALRAAGHGRDTATPLQYARIANEYRTAAALVGESPRDFQAIVWVVLRERGRARLTDIHEIVA